MKSDINVLVVEDSTEVLGLLARAFRRTEVRFRGANSIREAVDEAARERPDLMILDVRLPDGDALESMPRLREACDGWQIPVIAMSGMDPELLRSRAQTAGCWDCLAKPFTLYELADRVGKCLRDAPSPVAV